MSDPLGQDQSRTNPAASDVTGHPGLRIRAAREARGQTLLHLSILLKISERRLQAFEDGRWAEVGDITFVRALAQSLCRHLELDPAPVLQALPTAQVQPRQTPDRGRLPDSSVPSLKSLREPVRMPSGDGGSRLFTPVRLAVAGILAGALALALAPGDWWDSAPRTASAPVSRGGATEAVTTTSALSSPVVAPDGAASAAAAPASAPATMASGVVTPGTPAAALPSSAEPALGTAPLQLRATQDTWIQVSDARGQVILSRLLRSGEQLGVEGARPLRMRVGNVAGTEAIWLGRRVALDEQQRNNVADVELP